MILITYNTFFNPQFPFALNEAIGVFYLPAVSLKSRLKNIIKSPE